MAVREPGIIVGMAESIVSHPIRATITVGLATTLLQLLVRYGSDFLPQAHFLLFLIPFIPPFFVTRTAKRINERRAEHDFVNDAEPYIFVGFPKKLSVDAMLGTMPDMISDSADKHLNIPVRELMELEILPARIMADPENRKDIAEKLIADYRRHGSRGVLTNLAVLLKPAGQAAQVPYLMNSVLKKTGGRLKWQGTLIKQVQAG